MSNIIDDELYIFDVSGHSISRLNRKTLVKEKYWKTERQNCLSYTDREHGEFKRTNAVLSDDLKLYVVIGKELLIFELKE